MQTALLVAFRFPTCGNPYHGSRLKFGAMQTKTTQIDLCSMLVDKSLCVGIAGIVKTHRTGYINFLKPERTQQKYKVPKIRPMTFTKNQVKIEEVPANHTVWNRRISLFSLRTSDNNDEFPKRHYSTLPSTARKATKTTKDHSNAFNVHQRSFLSVQGLLCAQVPCAA